MLAAHWHDTQLIILRLIPATGSGRKLRHIQIDKFAQSCKITVYECETIYHLPPWDIYLSA
jgi:hypothetical protein